LRYGTAPLIDFGGVLKNYLSRYVRDVFAFVSAYSLAAISMLPMVAMNYGVFVIFVYLFVGAVGFLQIVAYAIFSAVIDSYRLKAVIFIVAASIFINASWEVLSFDPSVDFPHAVNWNRLVVVHLLVAFPIIYAFRERHQLKARWNRHM
jgi:hypothetical protein